MNPLQAPHRLGGHRQGGRQGSQECGQDEGTRPPGPLAEAAGLQCRIALTVAPESTRKAREFTAATLRRWGLSGLASDALVVASELVANAVRHGSGTGGGGAASAISLTWQYHADRLICVVTDRSHNPPVLLAPGPDAECGRGLQVVQALTVGWGWTVFSPWEKAVWAELAAAPCAEAAAAHPT